MLNEIDVQGLVTKAVSALKKTKQYNADGRTSSKLPEYNRIYRKTVEMADEISVHASLNTFPERLFRSKAPNEDPEQFKWRKENYKPVTRPYWNRAANITNRVWNEQNYHIIWEDEEQSEYFLKEYPYFKKIQNYFRQVVSRVKLEDANAVLAVQPIEIPMREVKDANGVTYGEEQDPTELVEPACIIYPSRQVIYFKEGHYCMVESAEKSEVEYSNKKERIGIIYDIYDEDNIWKAKQTGKQIDYTFEIELYYQHNLGELPAWKLGGLPIMDGEEVLWKSPYYDAVPVLDIALYDSSTLMASKIAGAFPVWWEYVDKCNATGCREGKVNRYDTDGMTVLGEMNCASCNGTGKGQRRSVFGTYEVAIPDRLNDQNVQTPPLGYVALDPAILNFIRAEFDYNTSLFYQMLNIDLSTDYAKGDETALGKQIDREEMFSFLLQFSNEVFMLLEHSIIAIGIMRYGESFVPPTIKSPMNFSIRSESDLTEELGVANTTNLPPQYILNLEREAIKVRWGNDARQSQIFDIIIATDSLFGKKDNEIGIGFGNGSITRMEVILHRYINMFIDAKEEVWFDQDISKQKEDLIADANDQESILYPSTFQQIIPPLA